MNNRAIQTLKLSLPALLLVLYCSALMAKPFIPQNEDTVLETLPGNLFSSSSKLTRLRRALAKRPHNLTLATHLADAYIKLGIKQGVYRYYGYAQAALKPWWNQPKPPPQVLKLRAKIKEQRHRYEAAIADLQTLLSTQPRNVQAWLDMSNLHRVKGEYQQALEACKSLSQLVGKTTMGLCRNPILAVTGSAEQAYYSLHDSLVWMRVRGSRGEIRSALTTMAGIAHSLGWDDKAEHDYQKVLGMGDPSLFVLRAYADFLIDQQRPDEVQALLKNHLKDNGILLRAAIAAQAAGDQERAQRYARMLGRRFQDVRLRNALPPHRRYTARYQLVLMDNPAKALEMAKVNWQKQKALRDTRNFLEAAVGANAPAAAGPAIEFIKVHKTQDVALARLIEQLERS